MKKNKYLIFALFVGLLINSCQKEDYEFGQVIAPKNITITAELVGKDATNPFGDGTGTVNFTVSAGKRIFLCILF